jgi:SM-20-related protein
MASEANNFIVLDESALLAAPLQREPYDHVLIDRAIKREFEASILADAPLINAVGSFALTSVKYGPGFAKLISDLLAPRFRHIIEEKLALDLGAYPTMITVRGYCARTRDAEGYVHTDSRHKIVTVLLYLNPAWQHAGGNLRVLRSKSIDDCALEIVPELGRMLIFRRSDNSWHARMPYEGPRLNLQLNWVKSSLYVKREYLRHQLSALAKASRPLRYLLHRVPRLTQ